VDRKNSPQIGCGPYRAYGVVLSPAASADVRNTNYTDGSSCDIDRMGHFSYAWDNLLEPTHRSYETL